MQSDLDSRSRPRVRLTGFPSGNDTGRGQTIAAAHHAVHGEDRPVAKDPIAALVVLAAAAGLANPRASRA